MKYVYSLVYICFLFLILTMKLPAQIDNEILKKKIGQMVMVGFYGTEMPDSIKYDIENRGLGGVILFGYNLSNPAQIKKLTGSLNNTAEIPLLISTDQEGGNVARLKASNGYEATKTAYMIGTLLNREDSARAIAAKMAGWLKDAGINMDLAPVADVMINPQSPALALKERLYSKGPEVVSKYVSYFIEEFNNKNVVTSLKHFPGHGSAATDSHMDLPDLTKTWSQQELIPYQRAIGNGYSDAVMIGHLFNKELDSLYPSSLSYNTVTGLLKNQLNFQGVVITDELMMGAIANNYGLEQSIELAINAGVDILLYKTNIYNGSSLLSQIQDIVIKKIAEGKILESRITEAYERIIQLKRKYGIYTDVANVNYTDSAIPETYSLSSYPNPFNPSATIVFELPKSSDVELKIFDMLGREAAVLLQGKMSAGRHSVGMSASGLASGTYICRLIAGNIIKSHKVLLVK